MIAFHVASNKRSVPVYVSVTPADAANRMLLLAATIAPKVLHIPAANNSGNFDSCQCPREYAGRNKVPSRAETGE